MKSLSIIFLLLIAIGTAHAQSWSKVFGMNYGFTLPTGGMKQNIRYGNGFGMSLLFTEPSNRLSIGPEFIYGNYGHSKSQQDYEFPDGTTAPMNIIVNNNFINMMATARLNLVVDGPIRPYATAKLGYSLFTTRLNIVDPNDNDSCEPVESNLLTHDGTIIYSAGGGVSIDAAAIFRKAQRGRVYIDVSSTITQGGRINYMNEDAPDPHMSHNSSTRAEEVQARFINTQTQVVHEHHVGYLYNSFVQMVDFRLGLTVNCSR
jgi:opacity protein-like surface antigen